MKIRNVRGMAALVLGFTLLISAAVNAKTLYVDGNIGDDSVTWANNSASTPWRTIGRAAWGSTNRAAPNSSQAAQAGDRVVIAAGTYSSSLTWSGGNGRWTVLYQAVNSGAAGNPITFEANGAVSIRAPSWGGPVIGTWNLNHIVWSGPFVIDETYIRTVPDTGPVVLSATIGSGIDGATIHGIGALWGDNHTGVRIEGCQQCFVRNTRIDNFLAGAGYTRNGAAIMMYNSDDTLIENNEFFDCQTGVSIKGVTDDSPMERTVVRYNIIRGMDFAAIFHQRSRDARIYQNVISGNSFAFFIGGTTDSAARRPVNDVIANNTITGSGGNAAIYYNGAMENVRLQNNIFSNAPAAHYSDGSANPSGLLARHNIYYATVGTFATFGGSSYGFESWKTTFNQDQATPASSTTNPRFVSQSDLRLLPDSPARSMGVDILDLDRDGSTTDTIPIGAYVTGNERIGPGGTRPGAPTQLRVE